MVVHMGEIRLSHGCTRGEACGSLEEDDGFNIRLARRENREVAQIQVTDGSSGQPSGPPSETTQGGHLPSLLDFILCHLWCSHYKFLQIQEY